MSDTQYAIKDNKCLTPVEADSLVPFNLELANSSPISVNTQSTSFATIFAAQSEKIVIISVGGAFNGLITGATQLLFDELPAGKRCITTAKVISADNSFPTYGGTYSMDALVEFNNEQITMKSPIGGGGRYQVTFMLIYEKV